MDSLDFKHVTTSMPHDILKYIFEQEKVHPMANFSQLEQRLGPGRRCFAYFHPSLPSEPLSFVHVALMRDIPDSIHAIIDQSILYEDNDATAAIFYSISSTRPGLALGQHLIKQATKHLQQENPSLKAFSTLSPIPNFCKWLFDQHLETGFRGLLDEPERRELQSFVSRSPLNEEAAEALSGLEEPILTVAGHYISKVKRCCEQGLAQKAMHCPVGHFHIRNGAEAWRLNFLADKSSDGIRKSLGTMINYKYNLDSIQLNSQLYAENGTICKGIAFSKQT